MERAVSFVGVTHRWSYFGMCHALRAGFAYKVLWSSLENGRQSQVCSEQTLQIANSSEVVWWSVHRKWKWQRFNPNRLLELPAYGQSGGSDSFQLRFKTSQPLLCQLGLVNFIVWLDQKTRATFTPIRCEPWTNHDLVTSVFPRFRHFALRF